jgi:hypothetical protein
MSVEEELAALRKQVREVSDRQEIADCILRYTRGVDRMDKELVKTAFHDDAIYMYGGGELSAHEFVELHEKNQAPRFNSQHCVSNMTIDIDGDSAHCESYYMGVLRNKGADEVDFHGGRYLDRLERRDGVWRIALRKPVPEWHVVQDGTLPSPSYGKTMAELTEGQYLGSRDRDDASYDRPLDAARF